MGVINAENIVLLRNDYVEMQGLLKTLNNHVATLGMCINSLKAKRTGNEDVGKRVQGRPVTSLSETRISSELAQGRRACCASIRDIVNTIDGTGSTCSGRMPMQDKVKGKY